MKVLKYSIKLRQLVYTKVTDKIRSFIVRSLFCEMTMVFKLTNCWNVTGGYRYWGS